MSQAKPKRFLLVSIKPREISQDDLLVQLEEVQRLVESYGGSVAGLVVQSREVHDKGLYIGSGKIAEVAGKVKSEGIDVVVLNGIIKPGHLFEIAQELRKHDKEVLVWDRVDLILQIFGQHAQTAEARLQIELASMRHMGPRIYGMGSELSRQGGGIGGRGIGETNTELMQRHWQTMMKRAQQKLEKLSNARERQMLRRKRVGLPTVSLVGYTNAGKTSLFNALTSKNKLAQDLLFATLDAATGKVYLPEVQQSILVSDTIGFIDNLPAELIEAFKSTLMEAINADLLIKVVDASDPNLKRHLEVVDKTLADLGLSDRPTLVAFNKIDAFPEALIQDLVEDYANLEPYFVSVKTGDGIAELKQAIGLALD